MLDTQPYLRFSSVMVCLDKDLSQSDVFTDSHQSLLHGLSCPQDRNTSNLHKQIRDEFDI